MSLQSIQAARQKREAQKSLDQEIEKSGASLPSFIRAGWHVLEPARPYKHGWHIDAISDHLQAVTHGQLTRLIINVPPGTMKSLAVGVFWPMWEWGPQGLPHLRTMATSFKESLAKRDNIKARRLAQSAWFRERWGHNFNLMGDQNEKLKFENDKTGFREAMAFGSITGSRGDRVIVDDPLSVDQAKSDTMRENAKETFLEALPNRLNDPEQSAIIMVMQRLHEDDPSGVALAKNMGYEHLMLPMEFEPDRRCYTVIKPSYMVSEAVQARYDGGKQVWYLDGQHVSEVRKPYVEKAELKTVYAHDIRKADGELLFEARFPKIVVERDKASLGSLGFAGQNQQRPAPREGSMFKRAYFRIVKAIPAGTVFTRGWDLAASEGSDAARTAGVKIGRQKDGRFIIAHMVADRVSPAGVRTLIKNIASQDGQTCRIALPQDPGAAGKVQKFDLTTLLAGYIVKAEPVTGDKETRAEPFAAQCEAGNVDILEGAWNEEYLDELCMFPNGKLKDLADASAEAFNDLSFGGNGPGMALFELMRQQAEDRAAEPKPEPLQPEYAPGSVEYMKAITGQT
ncbi:phage terminase large subunit [Rhizobium rhizogenes]|uniref:phage terminase large subunit n=1 Tax=Rhizobium rhizogenes TaxID=359 RepID=UPI0015724601|nr:phage terminase large subunit [Rhizobium rhizogenes]NTF67963.1 phage terminase large subunit [Rhizobium rhizogenes]